MAQSHLTQIAGLDTAIRTGRVAEARAELRNISVARVPRAHRLAYASLCRRAGWPTLGLRFLTPIMRDEKPTPAESAEYGVLLQRIGALEEAFKTLSSLEIPEALLYRSYCHFNRWEYYAAIPLLRDHASLESAPYARLVGGVNLAAALVATDAVAEAIEQLDLTLAAAREGGHRRLEGNCLEIRAQAHILKDDDMAAREDLERAQEILGDDISVAKWLAVLEARQTRASEPLRAFRERARQERDWESLRHADLQILRVEFNEELFHHHLFGSPWIGYRDKAQRTLGRVATREHFDFGEGGRVIDVARALIDGAEAFPPDGKLHRALVALTSDYYRPVASGAMFSALFPGEYYDAFSSPNRVHQALFRLRQWILDQQLPLKLEQGRDGYRLTRTGPLTLRCAYLPLDSKQALIVRVSQAFGRDEFGARDLTGKLGMTATEARNFLAWARDEGHLARLGAGPSTRYQLVIPVLKAA